MEFFSIIALILSIYTLIKIQQIDSKIKGINLPQKNLSQTSTPLPNKAVVTNTNVPPQTPPQTSSEPTSVDKLIAWYIHEWPLKTGALFILFGFIWLVTYAFLNNWVGPTGRITFGIIAGALTLFFGERRLNKVQSQGITLVGLGAAIMTVSIYAAQNLYHMFLPTVALLFFVIIMILTSVVSLKHRVLSLSVVSLLIGGLAPILIGSTEKSIWSLYTYLLAITIGTLWIARYSKWRILTFLSIIIVTIYSVEYFVTGYTSVQNSLTPNELFQLRFFAITFASIYFFTSLASIITNIKPTALDLQIAAAVGIFTFAWVHALVPPEYKSVTTMASSLFYSFASYAVFIKTKVKSGVLIYLTIATVLLAIATAFEFDGPVLVIAFSIQALLLPILGVSVLGIEIGKYFLLYFFLPGLMGIESIAFNEWDSGLLQNSFYSLTSVTLSFLISGLYFYKSQKEKEKPLHKITIVILIIAAVYGLAWIWKVFHTLFDQVYIARMSTLLLYTVIGLWTYVTGEINNRTVLNKFGLVLILYIIGRLLLVEIWTMELTMRIVTFFLIGLLFIGSVLLRKSTPKKT